MNTEHPTSATVGIAIGFVEIRRFWQWVHGVGGGISLNFPQAYQVCYLINILYRYRYCLEHSFVSCRLCIGYISLAKGAFTETSTGTSGPC